MVAILSTYPLLLSLLKSPNHNFPSKPHFSNPLYHPQITLKSATKSIPGTRIWFSKRRSDDPNEKSIKYLDEDGDVDDMDGYMNYLSLEYDSVWDTKPSWCQPWTIILTGVSAIGGSWLAVISTWWYIFLYSYPKSYTSMIAEQRKMVKTGAEDTFGRLINRSINSCIIPICGISNGALQR